MNRLITLIANNVHRRFISIKEFIIQSYKNKGE